MTRNLLAAGAQKLVKATVILTLVGAVIGWNTEQSAANSSPSVADLQSAIAALEARVAALEGQLQRSTGDGEQQAEHAGTPQPLLVALSEGSTYTPMQLGRPDQEIQAQPADIGWSGLYWGTSFGYGSAFSKSRYRAVSRDRDEERSVETSTDFDDDGTSDTSEQIQTFIGDNTSVTTGASDGTDQHEGVLADLYLGVNGHLTPRILAGVQVEGSLVEMSFNSDTERQDRAFTRSSTNASFEVSSDGSTSQSTNSSSSAGP